MKKKLQKYTLKCKIKNCKYSINKDMQFVYYKKKIKCEFCHYKQVNLLFSHSIPLEIKQKKNVCN